MKFLSLKTEAFGLDISDLSLKIIKLKRNGKCLRLASFGEAEIKPGIIKEGEIKDEESLAKIIKDTTSKIKGEKLKTNYVVASLPEEKAFLQVIQMPKMKKEEIKKAVLFEAENYIPMPIDEVYLDSQIIIPLRDHLNHIDVLIAGVPKKIVDSYVSCFKKAGLIIKSFEIESQAVSRALIKKEISPSPVLLVDIGATRTSLIVFSGRSLRFTSSIPLSSKIFTATISKALKVDIKEAEKLKIKYGVQVDSKKTAKKVFEAMVPGLTDLVEQIRKYLNYYQTHAAHEHLCLKGKEVKKIFLCGGGSNLRGLADFLSSELLLPVELGNSWINILPKPLKEVPEISFKKSLGYTTALGLALRGVNRE